jgi:hypothetical protein
MKYVIVSACYAIIAALISKRYLIFSSVSVSWNLTVFTTTKSGVSRRPVLLIFTKNTCIFFLQISYINMGYG